MKIVQTRPTAHVDRHLRALAVLVMLATSLLALAPVSIPTGEGIRGAEAAPTFHLPWEQGSVWQITVGNGVGEHSNAANYHGFDAVPAPGRGTDRVTAVADGVVMDFQEGMPDTDLVNGPHAGNCVILDHGGGVYSMYAHLRQNSVPVEAGQRITSGTVIGTMGNSGYSTGPHLHWSVVNSPRMYTDASISPYRTCAGDTIESRYADPDKELQEDGGIPRTGRYYESFNSPIGTTAGPVNQPPTLDLDVLQWCRDYYGDPAADAYPRDENNPYTWVCDTNGEQLSVDMMNAAERQYGPGYCAFVVGPTAYDWKAGPC